MPLEASTGGQGDQTNSLLIYFQKEQVRRKYFLGVFNGVILFGEGIGTLPQNKILKLKIVQETTRIKIKIYHFKKTSLVSNSQLY